VRSYLPNLTTYYGARRIYYYRDTIGIEVTPLINERDINGETKTIQHMD
jgi:hypothetical protein